MAGIVFVHNKYGYQDHGFKNDPWYDSSTVVS
jgi:hypothetical protein